MKNYHKIEYFKDYFDVNINYCLLFFIIFLVFPFYIKYFMFNIAIQKRDSRKPNRVGNI